MTVIAETERLLLRTWSMGDLAAAAEIWGDARVMASMVGAVAATDAALRAAVQREIDRQVQHGYQCWAVECSGEVIGASGFFPFDGGPILELSFKFAHAHWGHGFATEAGRAAIGYARSVLNPPLIVAGTLGENPASAGVLLKLGFVFKGERVWPDSKKADPYYELEEP